MHVRTHSWFLRCGAEERGRERNMPATESHAESSCLKRGRGWERRERTIERGREGGREIYIYREREREGERDRERERAIERERESEIER